MITLAREAVTTEGLSDRIELVQGYVPGVALKAHSFDAVLSKDLLHHVPDPSVLWMELARLGKPGAVVYVMDLVRPPTREEALRIVDRVAAREDPILREDFYNSLCAAFTVDELREQVAAAGLDLEVRQASDRHALISGVTSP
jgi:ubiquinone/menaquinone biosynthesis C-methylase UbiE